MKFPYFCTEHKTQKEMDKVKVKVSDKAFRDIESNYKRRRPGNIFECTRKRADVLIKGKWVTEIGGGKKELKVQEETKEEKIQETTK